MSIFDGLVDLNKNKLNISNEGEKYSKTETKLAAIAAGIGGAIAAGPVVGAGVAIAGLAASGKTGKIVEKLSNFMYGNSKKGNPNGKGQNVQLSQEDIPVAPSALIELGRKQAFELDQANKDKVIPIILRLTKVREVLASREDLPLITKPEVLKPWHLRFQGRAVVPEVKMYFDFRSKLYANELAEFLGKAVKSHPLDKVDPNAYLVFKPYEELGLLLGDIEAAINMAKEFKDFFTKVTGDYMLLVTELANKSIGLDQVSVDNMFTVLNKEYVDTVEDYIKFIEDFTIMVESAI